MADNVPITAGSGTNIATDEVTGTGEHVQVVKLAIAADGSRTAVPADGTDGLLVNLGTNNDVAVTGSVTANAGTNLNTSTLALEAGGNLAATKTAVELIDDTVFADDTGFTVGTSKVTASGLQAVAHGSNPDAADALDAVVQIANRHRVGFVIGGHPNIVTSGLLVQDSDNGQTNLAIGPGTIGAGTKIVVTRLSVTASNANTGNVACKIGFGTASVPADSLTPAADILLHHPGIPPGGGMTIGDGSGILGVGADGAELRLTCGDPAGGSLAVVASYYTIES